MDGSETEGFVCIDGGRTRQNGMDVDSLIFDLSHTKFLTDRLVATMASFQSLR
jgi:hypothetical protein